METQLEKLERVSAILEDMKEDMKEMSESNEDEELKLARDDISKAIEIVDIVNSMFISKMPGRKYFGLNTLIAGSLVRLRKSRILLDKELYKIYGIYFN